MNLSWPNLIARRPGGVALTCLLAWLLGGVGTASAADVPGEGDLVFYELYIQAGPHPSTRYYSYEWFEMVKVVEGDLDLSACGLSTGPATSKDPETDYGLVTFKESDQVTDRYGTEEPILFGYGSDAIIWDDAAAVGWSVEGDPDSVIHADFTYGQGASFKDNDSEWQYICLLCDPGGGTVEGNCLDPGDDEIVDLVTYQWTGDLDQECVDDYESYCAISYCDAEGDASALPDASENDMVSLVESSNWGYFDDEDVQTTYYWPEDIPEEEDTGYLWAGIHWAEFFGTPGAQNACQPPAKAPFAGELAFTEVMPRPNDEHSTRWFELTGVDIDPDAYEGAGYRELASCSIHIQEWSVSEDTGDTAGDTGAGGLWVDVVNHSFGSQGPRIEPDQSLLFSNEHCLFMDQGDAESTGTNEECPGGEWVVDLGYNMSDTMSLEDTYALELVCPTGDDGNNVTIDRIEMFVPDDQVKGVATMLCADRADAPYVESNDTDESWGDASFREQHLIDDLVYYEEVDTGLEMYCSFGTPGTFEECLSNDQDYPGDSRSRGCACGSTGGALSGLVALLTGLAALVARRRLRAETR